MVGDAEEGRRILIRQSEINIEYISRGRDGMQRMMPPQKLGYQIAAEIRVPKLRRDERLQTPQR